MNTRTSIYDSFLTQHEAQIRAKAYTAELEQIGEIICKHNLHAVLGVTLLHKHFEVDSTENLVGSFSEGFWCARPKTCALDSIKPCSWKLVIDTNSCSPEWKAIEFFEDVPELAGKTQIVHDLQTKNLFFQDATQIIMELGMANVFGLALLDNTTVQIVEGHSWFEVSSERSRKMVLCQVPTQEIGNLNAGATVWEFIPSPLGIPSRHLTVKNCAAGNSRCCCGDDTGARDVLMQLGSPAAALFSETD